MAKSNDKLFTFKKAQGYLAAQGLELSTQQVRNLSRTNPIVQAGVSEYTDQVTEDTVKVISQAALDAYIVWKRDNPESARGGRKASGTKRYGIVCTPDQFIEINEILGSRDLPTLVAPVKRGPRKPRVAQSDAPVSSDNAFDGIEVSELELIEVA